MRTVIVLAWDEFSPGADARDYDRLAISLANDGAWPDAAIPGAAGPTAFRAPLYPVVLAAVYVIAGDQAWTAARLLNALLGTAIVGLIGLIGLRLWGSRGAIATFNPLLIMVGSPVALDPLLVVLSLAAIAAALEHHRDPTRMAWAIAAGISLALAALAREQALLLAPFLLWLVASHGGDRPRRTGLHAGVAFVVAFVVVIAPWMVRNVLVLDAPVLVSTSSGVGLSGTYNATAMADPDSPGRWLPPWRDPHLEQVILEDLERSEVELDTVLRNEAIDWITDNPSSLGTTFVWGTIRTFDLDGGAHSRFVAPFIPYHERLVGPAVIGGWITLAMALAGLLVGAARRIPTALLAVPTTLWIFTAVGLSGGNRYRASLEPWLVLLGAFAVVALIDRVSPTSDGAPVDAP